MYEIKGRVTQKDLFDFNKYHYLNNFKRVHMILTLILLGVSFCITAYYDVFNVLYGNRALLDTTFIYIALFICITFVLFVFTLRRNVKRLYASNAFLSEENVIKISEENVLISSQSTNVELTKEKIHKISFSKKAIYLYISTIQAYIIPFHYINDIKRFEDIKQFFKVYYTK
jgi:hypothetical protein